MSWKRDLRGVVPLPATCRHHRSSVSAASNPSLAKWPSILQCTRVAAAEP